VGAQTSGDLATARVLFVEASEERDAGDVRGALEKFKAAHSLVKNPITAFELARTYALLGRLVEARSAYLSIEALPVQPGEADRATLARRDAPKAVEDLRSRIPTISVRTVAPRTVAIRFDGEAVAAATLIAPRAVDPGTHRLTAIGADGKRFEQEFNLREGESREVNLVLPLASAASSDPNEAQPPATLVSSPHPPVASSGNHFGPLADVGFVFGFAGFATGTVLSAMTLSKVSSAQCTQSACAQSAINDLESARPLAIASVLSYLVAGVGVAVGLTDLALYKPDANQRSSKLSIDPWIGAGSAGLDGSF
jgi:hypothetical protein